MPSVILKPGKDRRLIAGHCWVYAGEIARITGQPADGDTVDIRDHKERFLGRGLLNRRSQITVRRFTTQKEELDKDFFRRRIMAAANYRRSDIPVATSAMRVVFSESDQLPGLILDKYREHLVLQALTLGIDQRKAMIVEIARELFQPRAILERSDLPTRRLEGLPETKGVLFGNTDAKVQIEMGCRCEAASDGADSQSRPTTVRFELNLLEDQKTGFYLDQADNYAEVARHCPGRRVLDCFSYHGAFALFAAKAGAASVEAVEISEPAVARARRNAELNALAGQIEFVCANAFDVLKKYDSEKRQFDLIVLDPPSFTRTRQRIQEALRGYKEINLRALKMLPPGGILATFSCSHHIDAELFKAVVLDAAADARKPLRLLKRLTQARDHPILPAVPETEYLKGLLLQVL
jgi:23S rRNA (cytosine1962-C5)-methyltransferase